MNDVFCIVPWTHMYLHTTGEVFPCCYADRREPIGDLRKSSLREVWNGEGYRRMRLKMLRGEPVAACSRCYDLERAGSSSNRLHMNDKLSHHVPLVGTTERDGTVPKLNMPFLDARFSNVCNFKCRTCEHDSSSSWYSDAKALWPERRAPQVLRIHDDPEHVWEEVRDLLPRVEEIYFGGGEPLIMEEHYRILDRLVSLGRTDVTLRYNTNLSCLEYKGRSVLELWNRFSDVRVRASLDASGRRGEILRHGLDWSAVLENRARLRERAPRVKFAVSATVSAMNAMHLPELHRELLGGGVVGAGGFEIDNIVAVPAWLSIRILPAGLKREIEKRYAAHLRWLARSAAGRGLLPRGGRGAEEHLARSFRRIVSFMNAEDRSALVPRFLEYTKRLDELRGEDFFSAFPELAPLAGGDARHPEQQVNRAASAAGAPKGAAALVAPAAKRGAPVRCRASWRVAAGSARRS